MNSERPSNSMDGIVRGLPKRTMNPIVDGIVTGVPRKAHPSAATPVEKTMGPCATMAPSNSFGSGIFAEGAGAPRGAAAPPAKKAAGRPKKAAGPDAEAPAPRGGKMRYGSA